jgi:hypothetical protein
MNTKSKIPSEAQAKRIAKCWADGRPTNVMVRGRGGAAAYNDPTSLVLVKNGWVAPTGTQYEENGYCWESHKITPAALLALECYLQKVRFKVTPTAAENAA